MNQKQLFYFFEVYKCRNIQAAADKLYLSHQGLSRVIRSLEEELGSELFIRSNRGLEPTDFARALIPHVKRLLEEYATIQGIHTLESSSKAVVTVYALDHFFGCFGAELLGDFHEQYPDITISILDTTDEYALECLSSGRCDFAVVNGPIDNTRFTAQPLLYARYCLRINKSHPLAAKNELHYTDFHGQNLIGKGRAYHCFRTNLDRQLLETGIELNVPFETTDEELLRDMVELNYGIAATYDFSAIRHCGPNTVIRYLDEENAGHHIYLTERANSIPTRAARLFKQYLLSSDLKTML